MTKTLKCEKYNEIIDIEKNPCPHPFDYCQFRKMCVINYSFKELKKSVNKKDEKEVKS